MKKYSLILLLIAVLSEMFFSCERELDHAPYLTYDGEANCTIAQLNNYHTVTPGTDSFDSLPKGTVICGTVVSSDEHGNCYKVLNIQDETGGIQIKINSTTLYHKYKIGQRIYVKCDGLVIGDYRQLNQLGYWANGGMEAIPSSKESLYIFRDSLLGQAVQPKIIKSATEVQFNDFNTLVTLENCSFVNAGNTTYSLPNASTDQDVRMKDGTIITVRTNNYADFASKILPNGSGNITGILTRYVTWTQNKIQLTIRDLNDVQGFGTEDVKYELNLNNDPFLTGWQSIKKIGTADWIYSSKKLTITGKDAEENDVWLISPNLNLYNLHNANLLLNHRIPTNGNSDKMKVYYSKSASGLNENDWIELPLINFPTAATDTKIDIPDDAFNGNAFRIAFRYHDDKLTNWTLNRIAIQIFTPEK
jgi:hypothetical protein